MQPSWEKNNNEKNNIREMYKWKNLKNYYPSH
jgi:hypothetical protein